jgi:signal transduction histidine kinase
MHASHTIQEYKNQILERWLDRVNEEIPESDAHQQYSVRNSIPILIDDLCDLLENGKYNSRLHSSKDHGERRSDFDNYSLMHVIREYRILKQVIFELLDEKATIDQRERNAIMFVIDQAIEQAGEAFFNMRQDEKEDARLKAEKIADDLQEEEVLRDNFFSGITHDLRNPINNIMMAVDFLQEYEVSQKSASGLLKAIKASAQRAEALIRDLLDINLIKSGNQLPVHPEVSDLCELVRRSVASFKPEVQERIQVRMSVPEFNGYWDSSLLTRAIDNLLQNAVKYGDSTLPITVKVVREEQQAIVSVHNEGTPIPEDKRSTLFNRFYRADEENASGWGLGLALVQGIVQAHQGKIDLQSEEGRGTTFTLRIPAGISRSNDGMQELQGTEI